MTERPRALKRCDEVAADVLAYWIHNRSPDPNEHWLIAWHEGRGAVTVIRKEDAGLLPQEFDHVPPSIQQSTRAVLGDASTYKHGATVTFMEVSEYLSWLPVLDGTNLNPDDYSTFEFVPFTDQLAFDQACEAKRQRTAKLNSEYLKACKKSSGNPRSILFGG